jgi:hypothetical protein
MVKLSYHAGSMTNPLRHSRSRRWWAGALLLALALRAYVPVGFMPGGTPFSLQICPEGFSGSVHAHHAGHGAGAEHDAHEHFAHCPFGSVPAAGPLSHGIDVAAVAGVAPRAQFFFSTELRSSKLKRAHAARAPPILA